MRILVASAILALFDYVLRLDPEDKTFDPNFNTSEQVVTKEFSRYEISTASLRGEWVVTGAARPHPAF